MRAWLLALMLAGTLCAAQSDKQRKTPPPADDYSGMYTFLQEGEFVQVNVEEGNRLTGFISRYSDNEKVIFLDHFFEKGTIQGRDISFTTKKVHGAWYDFKGAFGRGPGKTRNQEGYYVLKGTLTEYTSDANQEVKAKQREAEFRSFPQDEDEQPPKK